MKEIENVKEEDRQEIQRNMQELKEEIQQGKLFQKFNECRNTESG